MPRQKLIYFASIVVAVLVTVVRCVSYEYMFRIYFDGKYFTLPGQPIRCSGVGIGVCQASLALAKRSSNGVESTRVEVQVSSSSVMDKLQSIISHVQRLSQAECIEWLEWAECVE